MPTNPPLNPGTTVEFDIGQGLAIGKGIILAAEYDDGWYYHIDVQDGDTADAHRHENGELWVCDFEIRPVNDQA